MFRSVLRQIRADWKAHRCKCPERSRALSRGLETHVLLRDLWTIFSEFGCFITMLRIHLGQLKANPSMPNENSRERILCER